MTTQNNNNLVLKSNMLVMSNLSELRINELRFLDFYLSRLNPKDPDPEKASFVTFTKREFCEVMGLHEKVGFNVLKKSLDTLQRKKIEIPYKNDSGRGYISAILFPVIDTWVDRETNRITIRMACNTSIEGLFFELKGYISYALKYMIALKNGSGVLLYNRLKYQMYVGDAWDVSVPELRKVLGLTTKAYDEFKYVKRVIEDCVSEINAKTDIDVEYEVIRDWKVASRVVFRVTKKECTPLSLGSDTKEKTPHEEIIDFYAGAFEYAFEKTQVEAIVSAYLVSGKKDPYSSDDAVRLKIHDHLYAIHKKAISKKVEDTYGYVLKVVENLKSKKDK